MMVLSKEPVGFIEIIPVELRGQRTGSSYIQSLGVTQSFNYQVGDIYMDITPIVNLG